MTDTRDVVHANAHLPFVRAAVFTAAGTALGAAGHHAATDAPVAPGRLALAALVLFTAALPVARKPRSLVLWSTWTLTSQALLHLLLASGAPTAAAAHAHTAARHHGDTGAAHPATAHHGGASMVVAHFLAAVLVAVLVHRADAAWWNLAPTLRRLAYRFTLLSRPRSPVPIPAPRRVRTASGPLATARTARRLAHSLSRRGPPGSTAVAA